MIYEYKCTECNHVFENEMTLEEYEKLKNPIQCPQCNAEAKRTWGKVPVKFNFTGTMGKRYLT